jgi:endonuclease/exonuclease/phosphatase family metal-dependent hydrolase
MAAPKFTTTTTTASVAQSLNFKPSGNAVCIEFVNTNGNRIIETAKIDSAKSDAILCFAEKPVEAADDIHYQVGGMASDYPGGDRIFRGTGKGVGFRLPPGYQLTQLVQANHKKYIDKDGVKVMGVRSTDFHLIKTDQGDMFWLIVLHLAVGSLVADLETLKRYRILKSVMAQAHHLMARYSHPVFMIGDFNCTRADLLKFKQNEEGAANARGNVLIPPSTGGTTIGKFKTCFRFDNSEGLDLTTNIDLNTSDWFDIDHFFVPTSTIISEFKIDRASILQEGDSYVHDHAHLELELIL